MNLKHIHESKKVRIVLSGVVAIVLALAIFGAGISVGYHKARFAGQFGENFERNFLGPKHDLRESFMGNMMPGGHGAVGQIVSVNLPQIVVEGNDNLEKSVILNASTTVRLFQDDIDPSQLKAGQLIVVLGTPNDQGQIEANFIRVMPEPDDSF